MNFSDNGVRFSVKFYVGNHILRIFFELMNVSASKQRRKTRKWPNILNWKITWEIEIVNYLERLSWLDFHSNGILKISPCSRWCGNSNDEANFFWKIFRIFEKIFSKIPESREIF